MSDSIASQATQEPPEAAAPSGAQNQADTPRQTEPEPGLTRLGRTLKSSTLLPLLLAGAAGIALIVALFMWSGAESYRVLFNNLSDADGGSILSALEEQGVPYRLSAGGQAILVPADQVHVLRLQLAEQGLPQGGNVGFELMDNQAFGISQFAEQVNYQRSLEGELTRTIASMNPVSAARVHLSMAKPSVFVREHEPAKASVVLTLHSGRTLSQGQVNAIVHLVSSSVPELSPDHVTVVDQRGDLLSDSSRNSALDGDHLSYAQAVERRYQQRIESLLSPLFGGDNIQIQVAAEIDFSIREQTLETYGPNQDPATAAVRSSQSSGALRGADALARGIPGALSNTPPGWELSPINTEEDTGETVTVTTDDDFQYDNLINYEVDRNITHIQHQQGQVQRLSVAAIINYRDGFDEEGNPQQVPLNETELAQVDALIRQAMGFSAERGDELEVVNGPFTPQEATKEESPSWWSSAEAQHLLLNLGRYLLIGLLALLLFLVVLKPLLTRYLASLPAASPVPASTAGAAPVMQEEPETESPTSRPKRERKASSYEGDLYELRQIAKMDPRLIAMVVRSWMKKNG